MTAQPRMCDIDFNVNDTPQSLAALLVRLGPVLDALQSGQDSIPHVSLQRSGYLGPDAVALIAALHKRAEARGLVLHVELPSGPPKLHAFCHFCGLESIIQGRTPPNADHPECETVPLTWVSGGPGLYSEKVINLIRRHTEFGEEEADYLRVAFVEIIQNVVDHSASPFGAVFSARYMSGAREVRIAVVDCGDTIPEVLQRKYPELNTSVAALSAVVRGGFTTQSHQHNMGQGIKNLSLMVRHRKGRLIILSRDAMLEFHHSHGPRVVPMTGVMFRGTGVFFTMRIGVAD